MAMLKKILIATMLVGSTVAMAQPAHWDRAHDRDYRWKSIGMRSAEGGERNVIEVGRGMGQLHAIKLQAVRGEPRIARVEITFGDGERQEATLDRRLSARDPAAVIDLDRPGQRIVERVEVVMDRGSSGEIELVGGWIPATERAPVMSTPCERWRRRRRRCGARARCAGRFAP